MNTKICFKCQQPKDLGLFYKHPQMHDGYLGKCKECTKQDTKERAVLKQGQVRAYDFQRNQTAERKAYHRLHTVAWRSQNPEKYHAHNVVNNAVRNGQLVKPDACEICGKLAALHGHHYDYTVPLDVIWLCAECHGQIQ